MIICIYLALFNEYICIYLYRIIVSNIKLIYNGDEYKMDISSFFLIIKEKIRKINEIGKKMKKDLKYR